LSSLLRVENLRKDYPVRRGALRRTTGTVRAVDDVSLEVEQGATFGLLGESGCGKSTLARLVLALEPPTAGRVLFRGRDPHALDRGALKAWRQQVQLVSQDPASALPARMRAGRIVEEPLRVHGIGTAVERRTRAAELLAQVGLSPRHAASYQHQLSGGQRQRVVIARALALDPALLVCDEPVSALDVSVQAQVLNLLRSLQQRLGLTYLFISHDLGVVRHMADVIGVMYLGALVEQGPAAALYAQPLHPYTRILLDAVPSVHRAGRQERGARPAAGEPSQAGLQEGGCPFRPRCPLATDRCQHERPPLRRVAPDRWSACHYAEQVPERLPGRTVA
jgi:oligopeptide/dipeptide ABC transporter ATP-binding protein